LSAGAKVCLGLEEQSADDEEDASHDGEAEDDYDADERVCRRVRRIHRQY